MADLSVLGSSGNLLTPVLKDDGSNWVLYNECMKDCLQDFWKHLRDCAKPPKELVLDDSTTKSQNLIDEYKVEMDAYLRKESFIQTVIMVHLCPDIKHLVLLVACGIKWLSIIGSKKCDITTKKP
jgi:hypothetical protein